MAGIHGLRFYPARRLRSITFQLDAQLARVGVVLSGVFAASGLPKSHAAVLARALCLPRNAAFERLAAHKKDGSPHSRPFSTPHLTVSSERLRRKSAIFLPRTRLLNHFNNAQDNFLLMGCEDLATIRSSPTDTVAPQTRLNPRMQATSLARLFRLGWFTLTISNGARTPMADDHDILTVKEICDLLRLHPSTVYKLIRQDKIPRFRVGNEWRFRTDLIMLWMAEKSMQTRQVRKVIESGVNGGIEIGNWDSLHFSR